MFRDARYFRLENNGKGGGEDTPRKTKVKVKMGKRVKAGRTRVEVNKADRLNQYSVDCL